MSCAQFQQQISAYIDGETDDRDAGELFTHLSGCDECRAFLRTTLQFQRVIAAFPPPDVSGELERRVLRIPDRATSQRPTVRVWLEELWRQRIAIPLPAAATTLLALLLSTAFALSLALRSDHPSAPDRPETVYIMEMPPVEIQGSPARQTTTILQGR
jgi:anti-sigma factor RsiW